MNTIRDAHWQLDVAQTCLELEARQRAIISILINKNLLTAQQFNDALNEVKNQEYFKGGFREIQEARKELDKPWDFMEMLKDLGGNK